MLSAHDHLTEFTTMTAVADALPKYARVAMAVRRQITEGRLRPGQAVPSGAALSRVTGYSTLTCRKALRLLIAEGLLVPGASRNARPRVAGVPLPRAQRDHVDAITALSAGLASRRHAAELTQPALAALAGVSVTTIGHAETGRLWQSRRFWERADAVLGAQGDLLRLHDAYRAASTSQPRPVGRPLLAGQALTGQEGPEPPGAPGLPEGLRLPEEGSGLPAPSHVMIVWDDGTVTVVQPPGTLSQQPDQPAP